MTALLWRDLRIAFRDPKGWLMAVIFFLLFLSLFAIALGGNAQVLKRIAPVSIWLALVFSLLLTFDTIFDADIRGGMFEQLHLSGTSNITIVSSKMLAGFIMSVLPLLAAIPVAGLLFQLSGVEIAAILTSVLLGAPALIAYGVLAGALLAGQRNTGFLAILMTLPFMVPVVIFALSAIDAYPVRGIWSLEFQALAGLSLISIAVSIPAAAAALSAYLDQ